MTLEIPRKSSQEVEIDHLLEEEFLCDPSFGERFLGACGKDCPGLKVHSAVAEPSLGGEGFGDLLIEGEDQSGPIVLLIEDKITAGAAVRQAERYTAHAQRMRADGKRVWTVIVAPKAYRGERARFDLSLDLETLAGLLSSNTPERLAHRRRVLLRAVDKSRTTGVKIPDQGVLALKRDYFAFAKTWSEQNFPGLVFPDLKPAYYDGSSWVERITHADLPQHVCLRHRLWTSVRNASGQVDLIAMPADDHDRERFTNATLPASWSEPYSKGRGVQLCIKMPEMRPAVGFQERTAQAALTAMQTLVSWYHSQG